ncbi:YTH1_family protein [Hexamita inflata]|uniref:YTH1 family protein n=1 Tax=Hexamita inflata TaxID=28002 RepID=A0AA86UHE8_9EUKA|nr:YTH1 family protein [Hexamita inflata]CAI9940288.1 YTH1 family protein [Hexamita inflata]CAI9944274.1 YTH1 family protein [Hexamita inflata]CAI9963605.1 YTH1 family protein [Hexamita inflata]
MDFEFEQNVKTKNKDYLDKFIQQKVQGYRQLEYDHSKKMKVCKHYLLDRCYRDDDCDYAHEIVPAKMPDCKFYENCTDYFCHFKHRDENQINQGCADFQRGVEFDECNCKKRGKVQQLCPNYAAGFCPDGPRCQFGHPRWDQPLNRAEINSQAIAPCQHCGSFHLATGMYQEDWDRDRWCDNSCSVIFKCHNPKTAKLQKFQKWFKTGGRSYELLLQVLKQLEDDEIRAQKMWRNE